MHLAHLASIRLSFFLFPLIRIFPESPHIQASNFLHLCCTLHTAHCTHRCILTGFATNSVTQIRPTPNLAPRFCFLRVIPALIPCGLPFNRRTQALSAQSPSRLSFVLIHLIPPSPSSYSSFFFYPAAQQNLAIPGLSPHTTLLDSQAAGSSLRLPQLLCLWLVLSGIFVLSLHHTTICLGTHFVITRSARPTPSSHTLFLLRPLLLERYCR